MACHKMIEFYSVKLSILLSNASIARIIIMILRVHIHIYLVLPPNHTRSAPVGKNIQLGAAHIQALNKHVYIHSQILIQSSVKKTKNWRPLTASPELLVRQ